MRRDVRAFLWDVREAADRIEEFPRNVDLDEYKSDAMVRSAVERQLEIIGEALNYLATLDPEMAARIPASRQAIGLRNVLIHGYATVDDALVWHTAGTDVPLLRSRVAELLDELS